MFAPHYRRPTVTAVAIPDSKRAARQRWIDRVEATMPDIYNGGQMFSTHFHYRGHKFLVRDLDARIADLREKQTHKGLNIAEERDLLVFERAVWQLRLKLRVRYLERVKQ